MYQKYKYYHRQKWLLKEKRIKIYSHIYNLFKSIFDKQTILDV